MEMTSL